MDKRYAVTAHKVYTEDKIINDAAVVIEDGKIIDIIDKLTLSGISDVYEFNGMQLIPGMIDSHIHGANGYDMMQADFTALNEMSKYLVQNGITAFIPTTVTGELSAIKKALANVSACIGNVEGAQILGAYVEGPYITAEYKGAHIAELIRPICLEEVKTFIDVSGKTVRTMALAPEKPGSLEVIKYLREQGIHAAIGHTGANYKPAQQAAAAGADIAVHIYSGMRTFHHREPGVVGAMLVNDNIYTELIADFIHCHPAAIEIVLRCKPKDKVVLISDGMQAVGLKDGQYTLGSLRVIVKDSIVRTESGSLAGSTINILQAVRSLIAKMGISPLAAVHMASLNPSRLHGLDRKLGSIKIGKQADLVVVDEDFSVIMTIIKGKVVYRRS